MSDLPAKLNPPPAWRVWDNPVFLRYRRSRLRMKGLLPGLLLTVIYCTFVVLLATVTADRATDFRPQSRRGQAELLQMERHLQQAEHLDPGHRQQLERQLEIMRAMASPMPPRMHYRSALVALLTLQALLLFVIGTAQVAGGMTTERDEGMVDYQRLAPMTPLAKTLGYLMGLPVREWVLFLVTLPFMAWTVWLGEVPFSSWGPVTLIFLTSVMLYHLTGLVAGTVFRNRRWAFLICMVSIFLLYFLVPQGSKLGLPFLRYVTMWPTMLESVHLLPPRMVLGLREVTGHTPGAGVNFFQWNFTDLQFTLLVQGSFILTLMVMVWRKWRQADSHLLSKGWALLVFGWLCVLPLGSALQGVKDGSIFPVQQRIRDLAGSEPNRPLPGEAFTICGFYGLIMMVLLVVTVIMLSPSRDTQTRGLRRAAKLGRKRAPLLSDEFSAFGMVVILTIAGAASWTWFTRSVLGSDWFKADPGMPAFFLFLAVLAPVTLGLHTLLEARGGRWPFLAIVFCGVVPVMAAMVVAAASRQSPAPATVTAGASPAVLTFYAVEKLMPPEFSKSDGVGEFRRASRQALIIWPVVYGAGALLCMRGLRRHWKQLRRQ